MPKQKGLLPLTGSLDNLTFYRNKEYGNLARRKGGPTSEQVKKDKRYDITRRNNSEFGRASHYGKLLRRAFASLIRHCKETRLDTNLSQRLREIMQMDNESEFGKRDLRRDTIHVFRHFELDSKSLSSQYFELPVETELQGNYLAITAGVCFNRKLQGIAAWKIKSVAVSINFVNETIDRDERESYLYELKKGNFAQELRHYLKDEGLVFHGMVIVFYRYDAVIDDYRPVKEEHVNAGFIRYCGA